MKTRRYFNTAAVCAVLRMRVDSTASAADQKQPIAEAVARIVEAREKTEDYVLQVKQRFKPGTPDYHEGRNLYVDAMSKQNAWVALVKVSIQNGKKKNLDKDERYRSLAAAAEQATQVFIRFVQTKTGTSPDRALAIPLVAGTGLSIWNAIKDTKQQSRDAEAERFEKEVRWKNWDAIVATP
ncbi:MAG TPA: hypothetical protein VKE70_34605 [Candidatus Solibacter sp.]|nr:hypothetical protein [Candidatus Solibacter sp.]